MTQRSLDGFIRFGNVLAARRQRARDRCAGDAQQGTEHQRRGFARATQVLLGADGGRGHRDESVHVAIVHGVVSNVAHPSAQASITTRPAFARETQTSISSSPSTVRPRRSTCPPSTLTLQVPQNPCWQE